MKTTCEGCHKAKGNQWFRKGGILGTDYWVCQECYDRAEYIKENEKK